MIGRADWDREFLIGQSAPRLANKNRVRERSEGVSDESVLKCSRQSREFVLFHDSELCVLLTLQNPAEPCRTLQEPVFFSHCSFTTRITVPVLLPVPYWD